MVTDSESDVDETADIHETLTESDFDVTTFDPDVLPEIIIEEADNSCSEKSDTMKNKEAEAWMQSIQKEAAKIRAADAGRSGKETGLQ